MLSPHLIPSVGSGTKDFRSLRIKVRPALAWCRWGLNGPDVPSHMWRSVCGWILFETDCWYSHETACDKLYNKNVKNSIFILWKSWVPTIQLAGKIAKLSDRKCWFPVTNLSLHTGFFLIIFILLTLEQCSSYLFFKQIKQISKKKTDKSICSSY